MAGGLRRTHRLPAGSPAETAPGERRGTAGPLRQRAESLEDVPQQRPLAAPQSFEEGGLRDAQLGGDGLGTSSSRHLEVAHLVGGLHRLGLCRREVPAGVDAALALGPERRDALQTDADGLAGRLKDAVQHLLTDDGADVALDALPVADRLHQEPLLDESVDDAALLGETPEGVLLAGLSAVEIPDPVVVVQRVADTRVGNREPQQRVAVVPSERRRRLDFRRRRPGGVGQRAVVAGDAELDDETLRNHALATAG